MENYLTWPDYTIIAILLISVVISLARGFVREALSLITWIIAIWVAIKCSPWVGERFIFFVHATSIRMAIAFTILLIAIVVIGAIANHYIARFVHGSGLKAMDRVLGFLFGVARGVLLVGVFVLFSNISAWAESPAWKQANIVPWFQGIASWLEQFLPVQLDQVQWLQTDTSANKQPSANNVPLEKWTTKPS